MTLVQEASNEQKRWMSCTLINTSKLPTHAQDCMKKTASFRFLPLHLTNHHYAYLNVTQLNTFLCITSQKRGWQFTF